MGSPPASFHYDLFACFSPATLPPLVPPPRTLIPKPLRQSAGRGPSQHPPCPLVAFLGGIDLAGGRFDTQQHSLFRTLHSLHVGDFHQNLIKVVTSDRAL